jgi:multidrug efflux pump subunit AcrA (membrane-fusion protein)
MEIVLGKYNLRAPFSGILTEALANQGSLVRQGQKLGEFIDPGVYEMEVAVNKSILSSLKVGKQVEVKDPENHLLSWSGRIIRINGSVDRATQTVKVYVELKGEALREGMYLEAIMNGEPFDNAIEIDRSLLVDEHFVYAVVDSTMQLMDIDPVFFNEKTVIIQGLDDGNKIISRIVPGAYSGMKVQIFQGE